MKSSPCLLAYPPTGFNTFDSTRPYPTIHSRTPWVRRAGLLRSSRTPSCAFASQSSSLRSSGDLTASPQVHPALTRPDACGAGASRDGHSHPLHSPAADPSRVHLFDRFSRDRQCRAGGSHIIPDRTRKAQDTAIRPQAANVQNGSITSAQIAAGPERQNGGIVRSSPSSFCVI